MEDYDSSTSHDLEDNSDIPNDFFNDQDDLDDYEMLLRLDDTIGPAKDRGLSELALLAHLPTRLYSGASKRAVRLGEELACVICLCDFERGDKILQLLDCDHSFHTECAYNWLKINAVCPICRVSVKLSPLAWP